MAKNTKDKKSHLFSKKNIESLINQVEEKLSMLDKDFKADKVVVSCAVSLNDEEKEKITNVLEKIIGKKMSISFKTKRSLLGGIKVQINDWSFDGSLLGKLNAVKKHMLS